MAPYYGIQCTLCNLDAVKPLVNILLFKKNGDLQYLAADTLQNISRLRRGRKLIRLSGGIHILVRSDDMFNIPILTTMFIFKVQILASSINVILTTKQEKSSAHQTVVKLATSCSDTLRLLCRSLKSQRILWYSIY